MVIDLKSCYREAVVSETMLGFKMDVTFLGKQVMIYLSLKTVCFACVLCRYKIYLVSTFLIADCSGCDVQYSSPYHQCFDSCGHLLTPFYPTVYEPNMRHTWHITVDEKKYISLAFITFDIYEKPLQQCLKDKVEIIDFDYDNNEISLGK